MKKTLLLSLLALALSSPAWAVDISTGLDGAYFYYNIVSEKDLTCELTYLSTAGSASGGITYISTYSGDLVIPETVYFNKSKTYTVIGIGEHACNNCTGLTSVTIPNTVTIISDYAFQGCSALKEITIGENVETIGMDVFSGCSAIKTVNFNAINCSSIYGSNSGTSPFKDSITQLSIANIGENVITIPAALFSDCSSMTELTISNSVTSIGDFAFSSCSGLTELTIPNSVTNIDRYAFGGCSGLTELTIPNSVTSIGQGAFMGLNGITELTIPNSVTSISQQAFESCNSLETVYFNATACSYLGKNISPFAYCSNLSTVKVGESVTMIPSYFFRGCTGIEEITLPENVATIEEGAFYGCTGLTEVVLPEKLKSVGGDAFVGCSNISIVTSLNPEPPICASNSFSSDTYNGILYVPLGTTKAYANASGWKNFKNIVPLEDPIPPTVTTLEATDITYYSATLNGSIVSGNEYILNVGFEFEDGSIIYDTTASYIGEGLFSVTIDCNWFPFVKGNTTYYYRAYAETDSGTYYGEDESFTTGLNGIDGIATDGTEIVGYYSTDGQQITSPTKGVNIVRLSDGTTKKVLVK